MLRRMFGRLFLLFSIVPFVELFLLLAVGREIGFWPTVGSIILTAFIGAALAKREGLRVWREWQTALAEMRVPEEGITSGLLVLVGGALLIAPGVLTDIAGILLMIGPIRRVVARWVERWARGYVEGARAEGAAGNVASGPMGPMPGFFTFRVVQNGRVVGAQGPRVSPQARRAAPRPRARGGVIEADGVVVEEHRPDVVDPPAISPDVIEGEIVD